MQVLTRASFTLINFSELFSFEMKSVVLFISVFFVTCIVYVHCSCLQYLSGQECSDIQNAGQKLSYKLNKLDSVIQEVIYRCIEEAYLIIESSMKYLRKEAHKVHIDFHGTTLIETKAMSQAIVDVNVIALHELHSANRLFWELLKRLTTSHIKDRNVVSALLMFQQRGKRDASSTNSLNGLVDASGSDIRKILQRVDDAMKNAAKKLFNIFADSLKVLIKGKLPVDVDKMKQQLEVFLTDNMKVSIESSTNRAKVLLLECISELEKIDTFVQPLKTDSNRLNHALKPARALVLEVLESTQNSALNKEIGDEIQKSVDLLKKYYYEIKNNI